jgi:16S rRNA (guanine527-N7)-methyltransferase
LLWPSTPWLLLEAGSKRAGFLQEAVERLELDGRVVIEHDRAEVVGRREERRGEAELVVARGFGPPATTAECASPLLRVGGALVVSEPPVGAAEDGRRDVGHSDRWPEEGLALLGLAVGERFEVSAGSYQRLDQELPCPARFPRRDGVPRKRPLW